MSDSEIKQYIWRPKESELTVSLANECKNHFGIFEQNNLYNNQFVLDNESNDLISDIQCDETFDIIKYDCNNTDPENFVDTRTDFTELSSNIKQQNTNFILNDLEKSFSRSERHRPECHELLLPQEDISVEPSILRYAHNISPPCHYETNDLKIDITYPKLFHELLKRFSRKITKVAIKTEIKSFLKQHVKTVLNEASLLSLPINPARTVGLDLMLNSNKSISNDEVTFQSIDLKNEDHVKTLKQTDSDEILVVQSIFHERINCRESLTTSQPRHLPISCARNYGLDDCTNGDFRCDWQPMSTTRNVYLGSYDDSSPPRKPSPKHRAMATSPIHLSEAFDDTNSRSFNLLNCMSGQNSRKSEFTKFRDKQKKLKSNSLSLFHRLFSRNKSRSKEPHYSTTHGYLADFSAVNSNLSLEKGQHHSFSSVPAKPTDQSDFDRLKNDWLEVDYYAKPNVLNNQSQLFNRAVSCQDNQKFSNSSSLKFELNFEEESKNSFSDLSSANNAVFIID